MSRRGGGRGGRRNRTTGARNGGQGGRSRNNLAPERVRFPSDHANRWDSRYEAWNAVRFPSDSNRYVEDEGTTGGLSGQGSRSRSSGRKGEGRGGNRQGEGTRYGGGRGRQDRGRRGGYADGRGGRSTTRSRGSRANRNKAGLSRKPLDSGRLPDGSIDPFQLFCTFHLGVTPAGLCRAADVAEAARRFDATPEMILEALDAHGMTADAVKEAGFDLELAQMDIKVSPPGVSKMELAKGLFEEYLDARRQVAAGVSGDGPEADAVFETDPLQPAAEGSSGSSNAIPAEGLEAAGGSSAEDAPL